MTQPSLAEKMTGQSQLAAPVFPLMQMDMPGRLAFGPGALDTIAPWLAEHGAKSVLVVADAFNASRVGMLGLDGVVTVFGDVMPEPDLPNLESLLQVAARCGAQAVIGFGGGSAMDLAKLAAVLAGTGLALADVVGVERAPARKVALIQVPTTAGTGSEAGTRALVTDPVSRNKMAVQSRHMLADLAVIDPDLTLSAPPALTAATGVDALAHCVEAFTNRKAHPLIDLYALEGIRLIGRWLPRAIKDCSDRDARSALALASLYGGFCLGPVNTSAGHAVAYPLGSRHHVPHGAANALIFPHTLAFNAPARPERTRQILDALGLPATDDPGLVLSLTLDWCRSLGCEMRLSALGVPEADLPVMAAEAHAIRRLLDNNPRDLGVEQILDIYRVAY